MNVRLITLVFFVLALTRLGSARLRDWKEYPAVKVVAPTAQVYALGDVHGDYEKLVTLLVGTHLISGAPATPGAAEWAGGGDTLICTGDMIDKGPESLEVLRLMRALQASASRSHGQVVALLGNHEAEFLASSKNVSVSGELARELQLAGIDAQAVVNGTDAEGLGEWLFTRPVAAKSGAWFFCHAGNTGGSSVAELEASIEAGVNHDGFGAAVLSEPNSILEAKLAPVPWWVRASKDKNAVGEETLKGYARALGCEHIVMGHQPGNVNFGNGVTRKAGKPFAFGGVLFLMDTGMSRGVRDGEACVLRITSGEAVAVDSMGKETRLWPAP